MSAPGTDIQWYIARDGKQHGPVSDAELKKIVELAHLKPTDLVWRQGFTDWRAASSVFPSLAAPAPEPGPAPAPAAAPPSDDQAATKTSAVLSAPIKGTGSKAYAG